MQSWVSLTTCRDKQATTVSKTRVSESNEVPKLMGLETCTAEQESCVQEEEQTDVEEVEVGRCRTIER